MDLRRFPHPGLLVGLATLAGIGLSPGADLFWRTDGTAGVWDEENWSETAATSTGGTDWANLSNAFFTADSTVTFGTTDIGNVSVSNGIEVVVTEDGTLGTNGAVRTISVGSGSTLTWTSQSLSGASGEQGMGFIKDGAGTWNMGAWGTSSTSNTGDFTVNDGRVITTGNHSFGRGELNVNGGTIESNHTSINNTQINVGGNFAWEGSGNIDWSPDVDLGVATRTITTAGNTKTLSGALSNGGLTKAGSTALTLAGANSYTGATTVSGGTLQIGDGGTSGSLSTSSTLSVASGATLAFNRSDSITQGTDFASGISGAGALRVVAGSVTLNSANNYSGGTTLEGGTIELGHADAIGSSGTITFDEGVLRHTASNTTDYSGRFATVDGQRFSIDTNGQDVTWATGLTSGGVGNGLRKTGSGTLTLAGFSDYTGDTEVIGGVLEVSGSTPVDADVLVSSGAALRGSGGTIGGDTTLAANATLSAGSGAGGIGTLNFQRNLDFDTGSIFAWDLSVDNPASDTSSTSQDAVVGAGSASLLEGSGATFSILLAAGQSFDDAFWAAEQTWSNLFASFTEASFDLGSIFTTVSTTANPTTQGSFSLGSNSLTWTPIPEPGTALAGLLLGAGLLRRRR